MSKPLTDMDLIPPIRDAFAMHADHYDNGGSDYSVTTLLNPTRVVHLEKRHMSKVTLTVVQQVASFMGVAVHDYLEKMLLGYNKWNDSPVYTCEERYEVSFADRTVSGAYDILYLIENNMWDLKTTKCATMVRNRGLKSDWEKQQNMYRYLLYKNKVHTVDNLNIIGLYWDWSKYGAYQVKDRNERKYYPKEQITKISLPVWTHKKTAGFMEDRVVDLKHHENTPDDRLPPCTYEEMWSDPDKYAVKLKGRARALTAQCTSKEDAEDYIVEHQYNNDTKLGDYTTEFRPSRRIRCEDWCPCNQFCSEWHKYNSCS